MSPESGSPDYPFIPRSTLAEVNDHIARGDTWKQLWHWLGLPDPAQATNSRANDWWAISPFQPGERTPSFHMNAKGWYCFATGQGGSFLNLVAELLGKNIYHAAHDVRETLLGVSALIPEVAHAKQTFRLHAQNALSGDPNPPIQADLTKSEYLSADDPRFDHRGIPVALFEQLGAGFLDRPARKDGRPDHLNQRHVFQVRGVREKGAGLYPVILTHMGRASLEDQAQKWWIFPGFQSRFELYNLDLALLDPLAQQQATETGHVVVVEGAYDVARLLSANIRNVVATFGKQLHATQIPQFQLLAEHLNIDRFLIFYDRGQDGHSYTPLGNVETGAVQAADVLSDAGLEAEIFQWDRTFSNSVRQDVAIPAEITDPCEFSSSALAWFRDKGFV